ncbi:hypothetical protein GCM10028778_08010 [Barrientosiimonas marina]|uniref:Uncharacterized protein n=1 Tax=Lentibacillus kimchii TaxID=1542911 RepID=A0ABW2UWI4_9BACI
MNDNLKYELIDVEDKLSEEQLKTLWEDLRQYKTSIINQLENEGSLESPLAIKWVGNQHQSPSFRSFNFRLNDGKIEVRIAD